MVRKGVEDEAEAATQDEQYHCEREGESAWCDCKDRFGELALSILSGAAMEGTR